MRPRYPGKADQFISGAESGVGPAPLRAILVLALMAEGRSNGDIAAALVVSDSAVAKHINSIFAKLGLSAADGDRRVLAVLHFLDSA
jgi:DNA-binding NarL/FixJ family response regulator